MNLSVKTFTLGALLATSQFAAAATCYADSQQTLDNCIAQISAGTADKLEITQNIYCTPSGSGCSYALRDLTNSARQIEIYGSNPGIFLFRNPAASLFKIENSKNITIRGFNIADNQKRNLDYQSCTFATPQTTPITIGRNSLNGAGISTNITIKNVSIDTGEPRIIDIGSADSISILNSFFSGSGHFGIWMSSQQEKTRISIFDNTFTGIGANAILTSNIDHVWIAGNKFYNNHATNPFCLPGGAHTGGGQIDIESGTKNLAFQGNQVYSGGNAAVSGIEFADGSVAPISNITISGNYIYGNPVAAVFFNNAVSTQGVTDVTIKDNAIYNNSVPQIKLNGHRSVDAYNNYLTEDLSQSPRANFADTLKTCNLNGAMACALAISWATTNAGNVSVIVDGVGLFSSNANWTQTAPWIGAPGAVFEIYGSTNGQAEPIARYFVRGM
jgi:hypothetical protein